MATEWTPFQPIEIEEDAWPGYKQFLQREYKQFRWDAECYQNFRTLTPAEKDVFARTRMIQYFQDRAQAPWLDKSQELLYLKGIPVPSDAEYLSILPSWSPPLEHWLPPRCRELREMGATKEERGKIRHQRKLDERKRQERKRQEEKRQEEKRQDENFLSAFRSSPRKKQISFVLGAAYDDASHASRLFNRMHDIFW